MTATALGECCFSPLVKSTSGSGALGAIRTARLACSAGAPSSAFRSAWRRVVPPIIEIHARSCVQHGAFIAGMTRRRAGVADAATAMMIVMAMHEVIGPGLGARLAKHLAGSSGWCFAVRNTGGRVLMHHPPRSLTPNNCLIAFLSAARLVWAHVSKGFECLGLLNYYPGLGYHSTSNKAGVCAICMAPLECSVAGKSIVAVRQRFVSIRSRRALVSTIKNLEAST